MDKIIYGFPPVVGETPRVLILGSMPSVRSLSQQQYYAHPQNAFWKIQAALFDESFTTDYGLRLERLKNHGIALWDSVHSCIRPGSMDREIKAVEPNAIGHFLKENPSVRCVFCNGSASFTIFRRFHRTLAERVPVVQLISTSPAAARFTFEEKLENWRQIMDWL